MLTARIHRTAAAPLIVLAVLPGVLIAPAHALGEDDPPVTCPIPSACLIGVEKPGGSTRAPDSGVATAPAPLGCNIGALCPDEPAAAPAAGDVAERAVELLPLRGPEIGVAPEPGGRGLVGLPVWLWTEQTTETWGPVTRTATVTGLAVTATARAVSVSWAMGDGNEVVCYVPGTAYTPDAGLSESPDCGYVYTRSSRGEPGGVWTVTGTTSWEVEWHTVGGGESGVIETASASETTIRIDELQVVTQ